MITVSVDLVDNIMLGAYLEDALSGVAAVNQIQFIFSQLVVALGDGIIIVGGQYLGRDRTREFKNISAIAAQSAIALALILFTLVSFFPRGAVGLFTDNTAIIDEGVKYLNVVRFSYIFFAMSVVLTSTMRGIKKVRIALYMSIMALVLNCVLNYIFIYGKLGLREMGSAGAALGTLISRIAEFCVLTVYVFKCDRELRMRVRDYLRLDLGLMRDFFKVMLPTVIAAAMWGLNTAMQTVIFGHMDETRGGTIAANTVAVNLFTLVKSFAIGAASATSVIISRAIGEGDIDLVNSYAKRLQRIFVVIGIVGGIILFFIRIPILGLYTKLSPATRETANSFLMVLSVVFVGMAYQMPTNFGIAKGGGSTGYVMVLDTVSIWGIVIPLALLAAFVFDASPVVVVCCLNCDQIFKCVPAYLKVNHGHWIKKLTRET